MACSQRGACAGELYLAASAHLLSKELTLNSSGMSNYNNDYFHGAHHCPLQYACILGS